MEKRVFFVFVLIFVALSLSLVNAASSYSGKLQVSSGGGRIVISGPGQLPQHYCGNGVLESYLGEQCDGSDLGGASCVSLGYDFGTLSCQTNCVYDTSACGNNPEETTTTSSGGGGGGGRSYVSSCLENWQCSEWDKCKEGKQTRTCEEKNNCGTTSLEPSLKRECSVEGAGGEAGIGLNISEQGNGLLSRITGAVIGGGAGIIIPLIFILLVVISAILIYLRRK